MIELTNVTKTFDDRVILDNLNLNVKKGSIYGLVGPNGAGKTTVINHITGVYKQNSGSVKIFGEDVFENDAVKSRMLSIADDWYYYPGAKVKEMKDFYKSVYPTFDDAYYEKVRKTLNIDEKSLIRRMSKGMKKQVAFLLSLACRPELLILDEPLDGLDPVMRRQILSFLIDDVAEREMSILVSSHNLRELEDICDTIGIMHKGKMLIEKPLDDLKGIVHKYQTILTDEQVRELAGEFKILSSSKNGSVYTLIVSDDSMIVESRIRELSPQLCDKIKLTLEEVFIYELGGLGYDVKEIMGE